MDDHACTVLEFDKVRGYLASLAQCAGGRRLCLEIRPHTAVEDVRRAQQETAEMRGEIERSGRFALGAIHDLRNHLERSAIQNFHLEPEDLQKVAETLETAATLKGMFAGMQPACPCLFQHTEPLNGIENLAGRIRHCISPRGAIEDHASPRLAELRSRMGVLRTRIVRILERYLSDVDLNFAVQDDFITLRNNRFVIPVRSDRKAAIAGVVHDQSQSRATFFIEPLETLEINNSLQLTQREARNEEINILIGLTRAVDEQHASIVRNLEILEQFDCIHARACLAMAMSGVQPVISDACELHLKNCRHPILASRKAPAAADNAAAAAAEADSEPWQFDRPEVVAIDIIKEPDIQTLVITGANAGGKTVALKTVGLFVLMHQAGLQLPAEPPARIAVFDGLIADIGDEQNIETSMSTFSAHMGRIKNALETASQRCLILLDELGSGTDPAEGGALAVAILDHLRATGCTTVVTSHLSVLKNYAYAHANSENISVACDPRTQRPLYRLIYGQPGFSNAVSIARSIGIPESVLQAAQRHIGPDDSRSAELISALERTQRRLETGRRRLADIRNSTRLLHDACGRLFETMQKRRENILKNFEARSRALVREAENRLRAIIKEHRRGIRQAPDAGNKPETLQKLQSVKQELYRNFPAVPPGHVPVESLQPGQKVKVIRLNKTGSVASVDAAARRAEIKIGAVRIKAGFRELASAGHDAPQAKPPAQPRVSMPQQSGLNHDSSVNVIGMRVAEAIPLIDKHLDAALVQGADMLEIIHGRGTGRLMRAIHEHLAGHASVAGFTCGASPQAGSGVTHVELK